MTPLDHLLALAHAATPGPYSVKIPWSAFSAILSPTGALFHTAAPGPDTNPTQLEADHNYFAALAPAVVTALVRVAQAAQKHRVEGCGDPVLIAALATLHHTLEAE